MPTTEIRLFQQANGRVPLLDWLRELERKERRTHRKCLERILRLSQQGRELRRPLADHLEGGIFELRAKVGRVNYRILYFFFGSNAVVLSHGITKERTVPNEEIELAKSHRALVENNPDKYTATWPEV